MSTILFYFKGGIMRTEEIPLGSKWRHFKGSIMEVINIATNSETLEDMVGYKDDNR